MKQDNRQAQLILCLFGTIPVIWLGLLIAPAVSGGLPEIITVFPTAINNPFHIVFCEDSLKTVLIALCAYGMGIGVYLSTRRNYRRGEEHGSAKWAMPELWTRNTGTRGRSRISCLRKMCAWDWTEENTGEISTQLWSEEAERARVLILQSRISCRRILLLPS